MFFNTKHTEFFAKYTVVIFVDSVVFFVLFVVNAFYHREHGVFAKYMEKIIVYSMFFSALCGECFLPQSTRSFYKARRGNFCRLSGFHCALCGECFLPQRTRSFLQSTRRKLLCTPCFFVLFVVKEECFLLPHVQQTIEEKTFHADSHILSF